MQRHLAQPADHPILPRRSCPHKGVQQLVTKNKATEKPDVNSAEHGPAHHGYAGSPPAWNWKQGVGYSAVNVFHEESVQNLQDNSIAVTEACTVRAAYGTLLLQSCCRALTLTAEDFVSLGIFCTELCIPPFSPNCPSPTKALFFSRRIQAQIIVSLPKAECDGLIYSTRSTGIHETPTAGSEHFL